MHNDDPTVPFGIFFLSNVKLKYLILLLFQIFYKAKLNFLLIILKLSPEKSIHTQIFNLKGF